MNLIEVLGGYGAAKAEANSPIKLLNFFNYDQLDKELLEYRCQRNIFEVGDCVVKTNPKIKHAHVRVVISTSPSGGAVLDYQGFPYKFPCVRHATDEEIEAGRRL